MKTPTKLFWKYWPAFEAIEKIAEKIFLADNEGYTLSDKDLSEPQKRIKNALMEFRQGGLLYEL